MNDKKLKHLEFIQGVITRMNSNSFLIKGWSVTLIAAIFALAEKGVDLNYAIIAYMPAVIFWLLDGFYLSQEKQYRELYKEVSGKAEGDVDFSMDATKWNTGDQTWCSCIFTKTLLPFHGSLFTAVCIAMFLIPCFKLTIEYSSCNQAVQKSQKECPSLGDLPDPSSSVKAVSAKP